MSRCPNSVDGRHRDTRVKSGAFRGWWHCFLCGRHASSTAR